MRKIVVSEFVSLDGVMQAPGGKDEDTDSGFTQGGWTWPYWHDEIGAHFSAVMSESDAFLLFSWGARRGRSTEARSSRWRRAIRSAT